MMILAKLWLGLSRLRRRSRARLPRAPRVRFGEKFQDELFRLHGLDKAIVRARDISVSGISLERRGWFGGLKEGDSFFGTFRLERGEMPVKLRVVYVSDDSVGCAFEGDHEHLRGEILDQFRVEIAAATLREVKREVLRPQEDGAPRLFRSRGGCELFLVEDAERRLVRFELSMFGFFFEGGRDQDTRCGLLIEKLKHQRSSAITCASAVLSAEREMARQFVALISGLESNQRRDLISLLDA